MPCVHNHEQFANYLVCLEMPCIKRKPNSTDVGPQFGIYIYICICICIYMYTTSFDDPFLLPDLAVIKGNSLSSIELLILMAMKISLP